MKTTIKNASIIATIAIKAIGTFIAVSVVSGSRWRYVVSGVRVVRHQLALLGLPVLVPALAPVMATCPTTSTRTCNSRSNYSSVVA